MTGKPRPGVLDKAVLLFLFYRMRETIDGDGPMWWTVPELYHYARELGPEKEKKIRDFIRENSLENVQTAVTRLAKDFHLIDINGTKKRNRKVRYRVLPHSYWIFDALDELIGATIAATILNSKNKINENDIAVTFNNVNKCVRYLKSIIHDWIKSTYEISWPDDVQYGELLSELLNGPEADHPMSYIPLSPVIMDEMKDEGKDLEMNKMIMNSIFNYGVLIDYGLLERDYGDLINQYGNEKEIYAYREKEKETGIEVNKTTMIQYLKSLSKSKCGPVIAGHEFPRTDWLIILKQDEDETEL